MPSVFDRKFAALLLDMDGTVLSSIAAAERVWVAWAARHGIDAAALLPTIHGVRAVDTIRALDLPGVDAEQEAAWVAEAEIADVGGVQALPGVLPFLQSLPAEKWAIVTSAPLALARRRLQAAGVPLPSVLVTAEDVTAGKPRPDCYLLGAQRLGVSAADCLVFEDAAAGILAGEAAKATLLVVTATHAHALATPHQTLGSYETIKARVGADGWIALTPA